MQTNSRTCSPTNSDTNTCSTKTAADLTTADHGSAFKSGSTSLTIFTSRMPTDHEDTSLVCFKAGSATKTPMDTGTPITPMAADSTTLGPTPANLFLLTPMATSSVSTMMAVALISADHSKEKPFILIVMDGSMSKTLMDPLLMSTAPIMERLSSWALKTTFTAETQTGQDPISLAHGLASSSTLMNREDSTQKMVTKASPSYQAHSMEKQLSSTPRTVISTSQTQTVPAHTSPVHGQPAALSSPTPQDSTISKTPTDHEPTSTAHSPAKLSSSTTLATSTKRLSQAAEPTSQDHTLVKLSSSNQEPTISTSKTQTVPELISLVPLPSKRSILTPMATSIPSIPMVADSISLDPTPIKLSSAILKDSCTSKTPMGLSLTSQGPTLVK